MKSVVFVLVGAAVVGAAIAFYMLGKKSRLTFDEFIDEIEKNADNYMASASKESGVQYVGGDCLIEYMDNELRTTIKIYGQDKNGKWYSSTMTTQKPIMYFTNDPETAAKLEQLKKEPMTLKVEAPEA